MARGHRPPPRHGLEFWLRTVSGYVRVASPIIGLGLLVYSAAVDQFRNPALLTIAGGLMLAPVFTGK